MLKLTLNLPKKAEEELEKDFQRLEAITNKPKEFHVKEALVRYLKHADKLIKYYEGQRKKGNKGYTTEKLLEQLNLKEVDWKE